MAISIKHKFQSAKSDSADTSLVRPSNWNDTHDLTINGLSLLGKPTASVGAASEITLGAGLEFSGTTIRVIPGTYVDTSTAQTVGGVKTFNGNNIHSGANTFSGANTHSGNNTFSGVNNFTKTIILQKGADRASAATLTLGTDGNYFDVTGTTTITAIATMGVGGVLKLHFDGALTLTHHATNLILPTGANIVTAAGDEAEFVEYAAGQWRCVNYQRATGRPVANDVGGWELIETVDVSNVAAYIKTGLSAYRFLRATGRARNRVMTTGCTLYTSSNNGVSWVTAAEHSLQYVGRHGGSFYNGFSGGQPGYIMYWDNIHNAYDYAFDLQFTDFNKARMGPKYMHATVQGVSSAGSTYMYDLSTLNDGASGSVAMNAINIQATSGNIDMTISLWGIKG